MDHPAGDAERDPPGSIEHHGDRDAGHVAEGAPAARRRGIGQRDREGRKFFDQLVRGSWKHGQVADSYAVPAGEYLGGEPVAIFNPENSGEAVVIVEHLIPAEARVEFLLFNAFALNAGPIACLPLRHPIHAGFHTSFHFS